MIASLLIFLPIKSLVAEETILPLSFCPRASISEGRSGSVGWCDSGSGESEFESVGPSRWIDLALSACGESRVFTLGACRE